jgi:hypothetical protein
MELSNRANEEDGSMKKVLLGTTALAAVGLLVTSVAYADEEEMMAEEEMMMEEEMMEAQPVSVSLSGSVRAVIGGSSYDSSTFIWEHLEPVISGSATMDNGLTFGVGATIDLGGSWFDPGVAYDHALTIGGAFGDIQVGVKRSARGQMRIASAGATSSFGLNGPYQSGIAKVSSTHDSAAGIANRDPKIVYMSPDIGGIKVGASYAPNGSVNEQMAVAATVTQGLGDASVSVNLGYETGDNADGTSTEDLNAGLSISIDDVTLSGGMLDSDNGMGSEATITDIGASVAMGPMTLSAGWGSTDTTNMYALGAAYPLGEGVQLDVQLDFGNNDMPDAAEGEEDEWVQFMAGVAINF